MVSRSLTEVFVLMRNNAIHSRHIFAEQNNDSERVRLMRSNSHDMEAGMELRSESHAPPPWTDTLEEAHYVITRLKTKLAELQTRHEKQIRRPALDDTTEQQHIQRLTTEIGRHFTHAHTHLTVIKAQIRHGNQMPSKSHMISKLAVAMKCFINHFINQMRLLFCPMPRDDYCSTLKGNQTEQKLATNVVLALVTILQDLSVTFRTAQSTYLKSLTSREERSNAYFELPNFEELSLDDNDLLPGLSNNQTDLLFSLPSTSGTQKFDQDGDDFQARPAFSQKQLLLIQEENTRDVAEREEEVNKIVRSIVDLNDIFKDLGQMVHEQGTILDRIDYNIEQTQVQVHEGYKQLQKAERYQRTNRKMHCILMLAITVIVLVILLIIVKS